MLKIHLRLFITVCLLAVVILSSGCVFRRSLNYGLVDSEPMIPARISVMHCRAWPSTLNIPMMSASLSKTKKNSLVSADFCKEFDLHVLSAFKNQPYMRGFTPRLLKRIHLKNGYDINTFWNAFSGCLLYTSPSPRDS